MLCIYALLGPRLSHAELLPPGFRPQPLGVHALVGGKVVVKPGETIDPCNIIIRDGECNWFEGLQLLALYAILGLAFFYA